VNEAEVD